MSGRMVHLGDVAVDEDEFFARIITAAPPLSPEQERILRPLLAPSTPTAAERPRRKRAA